MLNQCQFIGNLGRDPEIRSTNDGRTIANLSLAVSEKWTDKNSGERKERTEWIRITVFDEKIAEVAQKYLTKGDKVFVSGQMQTRKYTDQQGVEKYSTEVVLQRFSGKLVMLGGKADGGQAADPNAAGGNTDPGASGGGGLPSDEIPFGPEMR